MRQYQQHMYKNRRNSDGCLIMAINIFWDEMWNKGVFVLCRRGKFLGLEN